MTIVEHEYGFTVKQTATHRIDVMPMLFTWRLHTIRLDEGPLAWSERFWCYAGRTEGLLAAVAAAMAWDGSDDTEPEGWNRNGQTGELRLDR